MGRKIENSYRCDVCNIDFHRASSAKHLRRKRHLENKKQNDMIITDWLLQEPFKKSKEIYNPEPLRQLARDYIKLDENQLNKCWLKS